MSASRDSSGNGNGSKAAEQARLSELFKLLASRRPQSQCLSTVGANSNASTNKPRGTNDMDATDADPVLRRLFNSTPISHKRDTLAGGTVTGTRPRRNTVASIPTAIPTRRPTSVHTSVSTDLPPRLPPVPQADEDIDTDDDNNDNLEAEAETALAKFPQAAAKKYPFTFKLMIYKLYKKEDWVKTIKEMLEKSKNEFKPLAEKEKENDVVYAGAKAEEESMPPPNKDGGAVRFKLVPPSPGPSARQRRTSGVGVGPMYTTHIRQRSMSTVGSSGATPGLYASSRPAATYSRSPFPKSPKSPPPFSPTSPNFSLNANSPSVAFTEPGVRVLKKRCVGRRRSMSLSVPSPLGTSNNNNENWEPQPRISGTWVYNAAVSRSASERPAAANSSSLAKYLPDDPPPSPTGGRFPGYAPLGTRNLNVPNVNGNTLQSKANGTAAPRMMMMSPAPTLMRPLAQVADNKERLIARRRAMTVGSVDNDDSITEQRKAAKRPFAG